MENSATCVSRNKTFKDLVTDILKNLYGKSFTQRISFGQERQHTYTGIIIVNNAENMTLNAHELIHNHKYYGV